MAPTQEPTFQEICERLGIPENLRKHIDPQNAARGKIAIARGMLPAPPKILLHMMFVLLGDEDKRVQRAAAKGVMDMPEEVLLGLINRETHPKLLEFLAYRRLDERRLMERVVLQQQINDKTICYLAECGSDRIAEMVSNNQERLVITPHIVNHLARNPVVGPAILDRVRSFQRLYGIVVPEPPPEARAPAPAPPQSSAEPASAPTAPAPPAPASAPAEQAAEPAPSRQPPGESLGAPQTLVARPLIGQLPADFVPGHVYVPPVPLEVYEPPPGLTNPLAALLSSWGIPLDPRFVAPPPDWVDDVAGPPILAPVAAEPVRALIDVDSVVVEPGTASLADSEFTFSMAESEDGFSAEMTDEDHAHDDESKADLAGQLREMTIGDKIKLAYKGNKPIRELLVRDTNKLVATAVVNSGRITDNEVMSIASNRSVHEDVIRALTNNKEYLRKYPVKLALVNNPKTPVSTAIGMLKSLHVKDLKMVATNRNISSAVFSQAARMWRMKKQGV